jgi:predicted nucleotidyltransferase
MVLGPSEVRQQVQRFVDELSRYIHVERAVLFGSYAYGAPHEDSDIDLAVVSPDFARLSRLERLEFLESVFKVRSTVILSERSERRISLFGANGEILRRFAPQNDITSEFEDTLLEEIAWDAQTHQIEPVGFTDEELESANITSVLSEIRDRGVIVPVSPRPTESLVLRDDRPKYTAWTTRDE